MKSTINIFRFTLLFILVNSMVFCHTGKNGTDSEKYNPVLLEATRTPVVRGASGPRGMKIVLALMLTPATSLDSLEYEGYFQPLNKIKTRGDTIWVEAHFYPDNSVRVGNESQGKEFSSNSCVLHYRLNNKNLTMAEIDLKLVQDLQKWK